MIYIYIHPVTQVRCREYIYIYQTTDTSYTYDTISTYIDIGSDQKICCYMATNTISIIPFPPAIPNTVFSGVGFDVRIHDFALICVFGETSVFKYICI